MQFRWGIRWATMASCLALSFAIPASLVEEIKASELRDNKVKRAHPQLNSVEEHAREVPYYSKPTAIKRGTNSLKNPIPDQQSLNDWEQEQSLYQSPEALASIQSSLYNTDNPFDDKTIAEYEKGFHYGTNKEKLDEALENAVLKSELYGDPAPLNQYRYYGNDDRRRRRRDARKIRLDTRIKREVDLTPEEILTILTLYENERQNNAYNSYRPWNAESDNDQNDDIEEEENWLDAPVYPHATGHNDVPSGYLFDEKPFEKRGRWGGYADRKKRFMVAKKRNDPTRELRYLNGPNKNDYYTLSQLLSNQREPNVPMYHRLVL